MYYTFRWTKKGIYLYARFEIDVSNMSDKTIGICLPLCYITYSFNNTLLTKICKYLRTDKTTC